LSSTLEPAEARRRHGHGARLHQDGHFQGHHERYYGSYYYADPCYWLTRRAVLTGSLYWWDRYYSCLSGYR
jgi:hypothetical protein